MGELLLTFAAIYVGLCAVVYLFQTRLIFVRGLGTGWTPETFSLAGEEVWLQTEDGERLHAWYLPAPDSSTCVFYHHGNAGDVGMRLERAGRLVAEGHSVLVYDYRGYGRSSGRPTERGVYRDAVAGWQYLTEVLGYEPRSIALFGESLGAAVAIELAQHVQPGAVVVESGFDSVAAMARRILPFLPTGLLLTQHFDSVSKIAGIDAPILIGHSPVDEVVPVARGRALYGAAGPGAVWHDLDRGHNDGGFFRTPADRQVLFGFLDQHLR